MWAEKNIIAYQKDFASRRTPAVSDKLSHKILEVLITNQEEMSQMPKFKGRTPHQRLYIFFFIQCFSKSNRQGANDGKEIWMVWLLVSGNEIWTSWKSQTKWALIKELTGISKVRADCPKSRKLLPGARKGSLPSCTPSYTIYFPSCSPHAFKTSPFPQMTEKRENYKHEYVKCIPQNLHINPVISCSLMKEMFRDKFSPCFYVMWRIS